jgi:hypothetical protein
MSQKVEIYIEWCDRVGSIPASYSEILFSNLIQETG